MREKMKELVKEIKNNNSRKSERVPTGWSVKQFKQVRGPKATCGGCKQKIGYKETCITHRYKANKNHRYHTEDKYHAKPSCLKKMKKNHLMSFMEKLWTHEEVKKAQKALKKDSEE